MNARKWDDALLDAMREVGDPAADVVVSEVVADHGVRRVNELMRSLVHNDGFVPHELPSGVRDYLRESGRLPAWRDEAAIARGEAFFEDNWPVIVTLLFCASLPSAYAAWKGAQVLYLTQRMTRHVERRIFETAQFILDVMAPHGLSGPGNGIRSAQKVRLMHSATRHIIEHDPAWSSQWDPSWGVPINQEDLAGTLMTFSLQVIRGMRHLGLTVTDEDAEAYLHAWKVVGHVMGVDERMLPADMAAANDLAETIFARHKGPSEAGTTLTAALLAFMQKKMPPPFKNAVPAELIRQSIDADVADMLGVPKANEKGLFVWLEKLFFKFMSGLDRNRKNRRFQEISQHLVQKLVTIERGGNRDLFQIPDTLRAPI